MKVLAVTPAFHPQVGGVEQVALELARHLPAEGVAMEVAHVAAGLRPCTEQVRGVTVHRLALHGNRFAGWAPALGALARGYDLLHVHDPQLLAITMNVRAFCAGLPAVLSTHGGFWHTHRKYLLKRLYEHTLLRGAVRHYRRVLASSAADFEYYRGITPRAVVCANGVDCTRFAAVRHRGPTDLLRWVYWGRLSDNKRIDLVIDYLAHAHRLGFPVDLLICGQDVDQRRAALEAQVAQLGLTGAVQFESGLSDAALAEALGERRVYVTASEHEGFGLAVVEALAAGLIVIARDRAPLNGFFVDGRSGCTLSFDHSAADLQKLAALLERRGAAVEAMEEAARAAAQSHDWRVVAPRYVRHYREVLAEGAKPCRSRFSY
jgi:alpha-1,3-mannosyltransferase